MLNSLLSAAVIIVPVSVPHGHFTALFTFSGVVRLARAPIHIIDLEFKSHLATYARPKRLISRCKIEIIRITLLKSAHSKPHPGPRQSRLIPIRGQSRLYNFCENQFRLKLYSNTQHSLPLDYPVRRSTVCVIEAFCPVPNFLILCRVMD